MTALWMLLKDVTVNQLIIFTRYKGDMKWDRQYINDTDKTDIIMGITYKIKRKTLQRSNSQNKQKKSVSHDHDNKQYFTKAEGRFLWPWNWYMSMLLRPDNNPWYDTPTLPELIFLTLPVSCIWQVIFSVHYMSIIAPTFLFTIRLGLGCSSPGYQVARASRWFRATMCLLPARSTFKWCSKVSTVVWLQMLLSVPELTCRMWLIGHDPPGPLCW